LASASASRGEVSAMPAGGKGEVMVSASVSVSGEEDELVKVSASREDEVSLNP
jgi:hypothetical protein